MMTIDNPLAADLDHVLEHTRELWQELRRERIFITGGTGFFGSWLLESFTWANDRLDLGASAMVLTRNLDAFREKAPHLAAHPSIHFHTGDIRSFDFPQGAFSHIIHAATESSSKLNSSAPLTMFDTIVEGTRHTLDFAAQCGVEKFLLTSSGAVYGKQPPELTHIPEDYPGAPDPADPLSAYGEGKRAAELLCALYANQYGLQTKIARCFAFVGPYLPLDIQFAIGNFIRDGLNGGPIIVQGDGTPLRSYLYAADLAIWLWTILSKGQSCRPYNVGSDDSLSISGISQMVAKAFSHPIQVDIRWLVHPNQAIERYVPSILRAQSELGLYSRISIEVGIAETIRLHRRSSGLG
jgi:nucleoside-diphosphate-sugar epimerase